MDFNQTPKKIAGAFGTILAARLDFPTSDPRTFALFAHCFTCAKDRVDDVRRAQLLEITEKCPAGRTLHPEVCVRACLAG